LILIVLIVISFRLILKLAADQGLADTQNSLGSLYANGQGVLQDYNEAMKWFKLASDQGNEVAKKILKL
jgi:TPR repeat protein